jgi:hypothetical protein
VSVPLGVGANHDDRRQAIHAIRASDTAMAEAGAERGVEGKQHVVRSAGQQRSRPPRSPSNRAIYEPRKNA